MLRRGEYPVALQHFDQIGIGNDGATASRSRSGGINGIDRAATAWESGWPPAYGGVAKTLFGA